MRTSLRRLTVLVLMVLVAAPACQHGSSNNGLLGGATPVGPLVMQIDWTPATAGDGNLDLGATTPAGFIGAGFVTDPACGHTGDAGFAGGAGPFQERMSCTNPAIGPYVLVVENYTNSPQTYLLSVTMNGVDVAGPGGGPLTGMYTIPANTNTNFGQNNCSACEIPFDL